MGSSSLRTTLGTRPCRRWKRALPGPWRRRRRVPEFYSASLSSRVLQRYHHIQAVPCLPRRNASKDRCRSSTHHIHRNRPGRRRRASTCYPRNNLSRSPDPLDTSFPSRIGGTAGARHNLRPTPRRPSCRWSRVAAVVVARLTARVVKRHVARLEHTEGSGVGAPLAEVARAPAPAPAKAPRVPDAARVRRIDRFVVNSAVVARDVVQATALRLFVLGDVLRCDAVENPFYCVSLRYTKNQT